MNINEIMKELAQWQRMQEEAAIKEMRSELKTIPTWLQYERNDRRFI